MHEYISYSGWLTFGNAKYALTSGQYCPAAMAFVVQTNVMFYVLLSLSF